MTSPTKNYFAALTDQQENRLHELMYDEKFHFGRDKLWGVYHDRFPKDQLSQRAVNSWLQRQPIHQTFQRNMKKGIIKPLLNSTRGYLSLDCAVMPPYNGFTTMYVILDTFSKRLYAAPFKAQTAANTVEFLETLQKTPNFKATIIQSDLGSEFKEPFISYLKKHDIILTHSKPHSPWSNPVERYNGTIKRALFAAMASDDTSDWPSLLPRIISNINATRSFATGERTITLDQSSDPHLHARVFKRLQNSAAKSYGNKARGTDLSIGDNVRKVFDYDSANITKPSKRGYFASQVYDIIGIIPSKFAAALPSYRLKNKDTGEVLKGTWARWQLILVPKDSYKPETQQRMDKPAIDNEGKYEIETIIKSMVNRRGETLYKVKWLGYKKPTWEPAQTIEEDAPEKVAEFNAAND